MGTRWHRFHNFWPCKWHDTGNPPWKQAFSEVDCDQCVLRAECLKTIVAWALRTYYDDGRRQASWTPDANEHHPCTASTCLLLRVPAHFIAWWVQLIKSQLTGWCNRLTCSQVPWHSLPKCSYSVQHWLFCLKILQNGSVASDYVQMMYSCQNIGKPCISHLSVTCQLSYENTGPIFARNLNSMETLPCCNSVTGHQIATNLCTCHDSTAVVPCTKFCSDHVLC